MGLNSPPATNDTDIYTQKSASTVTLQHSPGSAGHSHSLVMGKSHSKNSTYLNKQASLASFSDFVRIHNEFSTRYPSRTLRKYVPMYITYYMYGNNAYDVSCICFCYRGMYVVPSLYSGEFIILIFKKKLSSNTILI